MPYKSKKQATAVLLSEKRRGRTQSHASKAAKAQLRKSSKGGKRK